MITEVKLPQWSMSMTEGTLVEWKKEVGDKVEAGEDLCEVEAAKMTSTVESPVDGVLLKTCYEEDDAIPVMSVICYVGDEGDEIPE